MKQHTMQEIADYLGKNVAKDKNGFVYVFGASPHRQPTFWSGSNYCNITDVVSDADTHDWTHLVEPQTVDCEHAAHSRETGQCLGYANPECGDCVKYINNNTDDFVDSLR